MKLPLSIRIFLIICTTSEFNQFRSYKYTLLEGWNSNTYVRVECRPKKCICAAFRESISFIVRSSGNFSADLFPTSPLFTPHICAYSIGLINTSNRSLRLRSNSGLWIFSLTLISLYNACVHTTHIVFIITTCVCMQHLFTVICLWAWRTGQYST